MGVLIGLGCFAATALLLVGLFAAAVRSLMGSKREKAPPSRPKERAFTITIRNNTNDGGEHQPDDARWYGPGEVVKVAGLSLPGGCLYIGRRLAPISRSYRTE